MITSKKLLLFSLFVAFTVILSHIEARAAEIFLAKVTTDVNAKIYHVSVDINDESRELRKFLVTNKTPGEKSEVNEIGIKKFMQTGLTFTNNTPIVFAKVTTTNFDPYLGGTMLFDIIHNVLNGSRKVFDIDLAQDKDGWHLFKNKKIVTHILAHANRVPLVGTVGAKDLSYK